jgi:hypothetical protein
VSGPDEQERQRRLRHEEEELQRLVQRSPETPWPKRVGPGLTPGRDGFLYVSEADGLPEQHREHVVEVARRDGVIRYALTPGYPETDIDRSDRYRMMLEENSLQFHLEGVRNEDEAVEAVDQWMVDLIDMGHYPSRHMLRMIGGALKRLRWPHEGSPEKERRRSEEAAWLMYERMSIDHLAATKHKGARRPGPATRAEQDVAEMCGITVGGLQRKRTRYQQNLKEKEEDHWRQRMRFAKRPHDAEK